MISDIVLEKELPDPIKNSIEAYVGCVSGALLRDDYLEAIRDAGFDEVEINSEAPFPVDLVAGDPTVREMVEELKMPMEELREAAGSIFSVKVQGRKA